MYINTICHGRWTTCRDVLMLREARLQGGGGEPRQERRSRIADSDRAGAVAILFQCGYILAGYLPGPGMQASCNKDTCNTGILKHLQICHISDATCHVNIFPRR